MPYQANIPLANDLLSQSQGDILNNFTAIQAFVAVNHVDFNNADQGKHKWVTFPEQGAIPPAGSAFGATELGLYNAVNATTTKNELYINKTNQATVVQVPMTASILSTNSAPAANSVGYTLLPSGILLRWGSFTGITGLNIVTLSTGILPSGIISIQLTPYSTSTTDDDFSVRLVDILSPTQFRIFVSSRTSTGAATGGFQFLVIGYQ